MEDSGLKGYLYRNTGKKNWDLSMNDSGKEGGQILLGSQYEWFW